MKTFTNQPIAAATRRRKLLLSACAAASAAALLAGPAARTASAVEEIIFDLRVAGSGAKSATVSLGAPTVDLELFAYVLDLNGNAADTGFNSTQGAWRSASGGLLGNFATTVASPYDGSPASQNPAPVDLDGDGDLDVGAAASASSGFWIASNGPTGNFQSSGTQTIGGQPYRVFQLGTGTFSLTSFAGGTSTQLSYVPRTGDALVHPHKYFKDSTTTLTSVNGNDPAGRLGVGAAVSIALGGDDYAWTRGAGTNAWDAPGNWSIAAVPNSTRDSVTFGDAGVGTVALSGNRTIAGITFDNATGSYTLGNGATPGTLTLNNGSGVGTIAHAGGSGNTIDVQAISALNLNVDVAAGAPLTINSTMTMSALTKTGGGTLLLGAAAGAANSSVPTLNVNAGTVRVTQTQPIANSTLVLNGGTLDLRTDAAGGTNFNRPVVVGSASTIAAGTNSTASDGTHAFASLNIGSTTLNVTGTNGFDLAFNGPVTLRDAAATFNVATPGTDLRVAGAMAGSGGVVKAGAERMTIAGTQANTYAGPTIVNGGTLNFAKPAGVNAVGGNVTVNNTGTLLWAAGEQIPDSATLTLNAGGTINLAGFTETVSSFVDNGGTTLLGGGQLVVTGGDLLLGDGTEIASDVSLGRDLIYTGTTSPASVTGNIVLTSHNVNHHFNVADGAAETDVFLGGAITGATNVVKVGAGTLSYDGGAANTYTGATTVSAGTLVLAKLGATAIPAPLEVNGTGAVRLLASHQIADAVPLTLNGGGTLDLNGATEAVGSLGGAGGEIALNGGTLDVNQTIAQTFGGVVSGNGTLTKSGPATLTLAGTNTFTGGLTINRGALRVAADANLGAASAVVIAADATLATTASFATAKALSLGTGGSTSPAVDVAAATTLTVTGAIGAAGGDLRKTGAGTLLIGGTNATMNAGIQIDAGTLAVAGQRLLAQPKPIVVSAGATLDLTNAVNQTVNGLEGGGNVVLGPAVLTVEANAVGGSSFAGQITGPGSFSVAGGSTATLSGAGNIGGTLGVSGNATLAVIGGATFTAGKLEVVSPVDSPVLNLAATINVNAAEVHAVSGPGATVNVSGAGASLNVANDFHVGGTAGGAGGTGTVNVAAGATATVGGTLKVWDSAGTAVHLSGGALDVGTLDLDGNAAGLDWTAGTLRINNPLTVAGGGDALPGNNTVQAGQVLETADLLVGGGGNGARFSVAGGGTLRTRAGAAARIGTDAAGSGIVNVSGAGSTWTLDPGVPLRVADTGTGELSVETGASVVSQGDIVVGETPGIDGYLSVNSGAHLATTGSVFVGGTAANPLGGSGSVVAAGGRIDVAQAIHSFRGMLVSADTPGSVIAAHALVFDEGSLGGVSAFAKQGAVLEVGAGGLTTAGGGINVLAGPASPGTLRLGGDVAYLASSKTARIAGAPLAPGELPGAVDLLGGDRTFDIADGTQPTDFEVTAALVNGGVIKTGAGAMSIGGANDYAGATVVKAGTLGVDNGALPSGTAVTVAAGATLAFTADDTIASLAGGTAGGGGGGTVRLLNGATLTLGDATDTTYAGAFDGGGTGSLVKQGTGTFDAAGSLAGMSGVTVNRGVLRLGGANSALAGIVNVTGTGPTQGTLALAGDNLGAASLALAGGRVRYESSAAVARAISLGVGGGYVEVVPTATVNLDTALGGVGGLIKSGGGTLGLGAAALYGGQTDVLAGTLASGTAGAIPAESEVFIAGGATLALGAHDQALASVSGGGAITMNGAALAIGANDATTLFAGTISGSGSFAKDGAGALTLSGAIDIAGPTSVNAGTLVVAGSNSSTGGITVAAGAAVSVADAGRLGLASNVVTLAGGTLAATGSFKSANPIDVAAAGGAIDVADAHVFEQVGAVTGSGTLRKLGGGTVRLQSDTGAAGVVAVHAGKVQLADAATLPAVAQLNVGTGATLEIDNAAVNHPDRLRNGAPLQLGGGTLLFKGSAAETSGEGIGQLMLAAGASSVVLQQGAGGTTEVHFNGLALAAGATIDLAAPGAGLTNRMLIENAPAGFLGGWATVNAADFAKYDPALGVIPLADQDYSPDFTAGAHVRLAASPAAFAGATIQTLTLDARDAAINVAHGGQITLLRGGLLKGGVETATIGGAGGSIATDTGRLDVHTSGGDLTIASALTGPLALSKNGAGTLALTSAGAAHDFTGNIYLNAGTLRVAADANLGAGAGGGADNDLVFNGGTLHTTAPITFGAGRSLTFDGAGGTLHVGGASMDLVAQNQLAGAGALVKTGPGRLHVGAANAFSGPLTVRQGAVELSDVNALGGVTAGQRSTITLEPSATLDLRSEGPFPAQFDNDIVVLDNTPLTAATITTGTRSGAPAGQFQLGNLDIGQATLATGGTGGSLAFTGIVTLKGGAARFNTGRDLFFADRVTGAGSLTKLGPAKLTLGSGKDDAAANTYAGVTNIAGGVLELNKAAGTVAIPGDIVMSGGTLVLLQPRQISDKSAVLLTGGTFDLGGQSDSVQTLTNVGADVIVNGGTLTVGTTTISGGTTTIGAAPIKNAPSGAAGNGSGGGVTPAAATVTSAMVTETLIVSSGTTTVNPNASLEVGAGGLFFEGTGSPQITLVNDAANPGKMLLRGDVTSTVTSALPGGTGVATIASLTDTPLVGAVDLGDVIRTFTVSSAASNLVVTGAVTRGGIRKSSAGKLVLTAASDYALGTTVVGGTVEARDGALGSGPVTLSGGNLNLRSDAAVAHFGNDLVTGTATVDIDRVGGAGTTGTIQLGRLSIGGSRLRARGLNGGTLEFTGAATLTGGTSVIDNTVATVFSNAIGGTGNLTKDFGAATLTFSGAAANTYTGTTRVNAGVLRLNKSAGVNAIAGNLEAFTGGQVHWQNHDQVADAATLTLNGSASRIDLADFHDTVAAVELTAGTLATGTNGLLRVSGGITSYPSAVTANITGNIELTAGMHTIHATNVPKGGSTPVGGTAADDLVITANISGAGGITKTGPETLVLSGANTFTGGLVVAGGTLKNVGATTFSGPTTLDVATTLELPGNFNTAPGAVVTKSGAGTLSITGPQSHGAGAQLVVQQGAVHVNTDAGSAAGRTLTINATGGTLQLNNTQHLSALGVGNGAVATVQAGGPDKVIVTDTLDLADGGRINLNDHHLVVTAGSIGSFDGAAYTGLTGRLVAGYNGGAWDGNGITTAMPDALTGLTTIAIATAEQTGLATFAGVPVGGDDVLVMYTYGGDTNFDGKLDADDYGTIDFSVLVPGSSGYYDGDFNWDGVVNADDYGVIDFNILAQDDPMPAASAGAPLAGVSAPDLSFSTAVAPIAGVTAVPEPGSVAVVAGALAGVTFRRRRRRRDGQGRTSR